MPYVLPAGNAANFTVGYVDEVRPYNGLNFRLTSAGYSAPAGNAISLQFPWLYIYVAPAGNAADFTAAGQIIAADGAATYSGYLAAGTAKLGYLGTGAASYTGGRAQGVATVGRGAAGAAVYSGASASGAGTFTRRVRLGSETRGSWNRSRTAPINVASRHPATSIGAGCKAKAAWPVASTLPATAGSPWIRTRRTDDPRLSRWGAYGEMLVEASAAAWRNAERAEAAKLSPWGAYGPLLADDHGSRWFGTKAVDRVEAAPWWAFHIPTQRAKEYAAPAGDAVTFHVYGGGIRADFPDGGYVPPLGNAIGFQFGTDAYQAPWMVPGSVAPYIHPPGHRADFLYNPEMVLNVGADGKPVLGYSSRDPYRKAPWGAPRKNDTVRVAPWGRFAILVVPDTGVVTPGTDTPTPGQQIIIPVKRVYIVVNEIMLLRVSTATPIPCTNLSISFDCDSWLPQFTANIPEAARDAVMPDPSPVEVEAIVNGTQFRFIVEKVQRNRQFAQRAVTISGRGVACELDAPYATESHYSNASEMTAQQLIGDALTNTTYTQTWNITDWLVPAGAFSFQGTPAGVAGQVADAAGAVLAADWAERDLRMLPRYPFKPWEWGAATPDYVIPGAVTQTESLEWVEKPAYNVVYVSGVQAGVLGQVKRTGTAGDLAAPMVTHPLITHADAARQKGISILGDTGRKALMQISLPILSNLGVIDICKLIEFNDGSTTRRGIVRANSISATWPTVRQTITVEAEA